MRDRLVLCYHAVSRNWPAALAISSERLREQIGFLVRRGYRAVTFAELVRSKGQGRTMAITFDDAYRSVLERGLPVLAEFGVPATVFVPTDFPGRGEPMSWPGIDQWTPGPHEEELRCMSWDELRVLRKSGWEIGSHSRSHPRLSELDDRTLARELGGSREVCERELGDPCLTLAYPYGDHDERVQAAADDAGYLAAAALRLGPERPHSWPRVGVFRVDTPARFRLKVSPLTRRIRSSRAGSSMEARFRRLS
jgi:peptidoglycan/xylan/chitin deacetylase (PgdA/CDA1 family)